MIKQKAFIDVEIYKNYFLLSALCEDGRILEIEATEKLTESQRKKTANLMNAYKTVGFNSNSFDLYLIVMAIEGAPISAIKKVCDEIIKTNRAAWLIARDNNINIPDHWDHIDIIEIPIGNASLKIYGGRLNAPTIQDLPIEPDAIIKPDQHKDLREYCINDLKTTKLLHDSILPRLKLREAMSEQYGVDLRSKSDAQIAETVILSELKKETGKQYRKPDVKDNFCFKYQDPEIINFKSTELKELLSKILKTRFTLGPNGAVILPKFLKEERIIIKGVPYQMGIGGLHSCEKSQRIRPKSNELLFDLDVASYYPNIILQQELAPSTMGKPFLTIYKSLVERRIKAKRSGDKVTSETIKICVNGSFGKLGSKYSSLFAPELLIQTTITGQLALLMLIEAVTDAGATVVSANTDGIVVLCGKSQERAIKCAAFDWEMSTSYELERTDYKAIASRDVNNYVAVKLDGSTKGKGCFASQSIGKNPDGPIIFKAVSEFIASGKPVEQTIKECDNICRFVTLRKVAGGAVWKGEKLGKTVRFYHSSDVNLLGDAINYAKNSNKVPKSLGCRPVMKLPDRLPDDIDYSYYINEAKELIKAVGL